jgi:hypothetical protein
MPFLPFLFNRQTLKFLFPASAVKSEKKKGKAIPVTSREGP